MAPHVVSGTMKAAIWTCFFLFFPLILWIGYKLSPIAIEEMPLLHLVGFAILLIILALIPIVVGEVPLFLTQGVSLAILLSFGLFAEMVLTLISVIALMLKIRVSKDNLLRIPINLLMFSTISLICGAVYYALGGGHGDTRLLQPGVIVPILSHELMYFTLNSIALYMIQVSIYKGKVVL